MNRVLRSLAVLVIGGGAAVLLSAQQPREPLSENDKAARWATENELSSLAVIDRKVMIPMHDGIRIAADI